MQNAQGKPTNKDTADLIKYIAPAHCELLRNNKMIRDLVIYIKWHWDCWKQRKTLRIVRKQQEMLRRARKGINNGRQGSRRKP